MKRLIDLLRNSGSVRSLQIFQLLRFASFFLTGIVLSKGPASLQIIGSYETIMFFSSAISFFWISGILNSLLARYSLIHEDEKDVYIYNTIILIFLLNIALAVIVWLVVGTTPLFAGIKDHLFYLLIYILLNNPTFANEYILLLRRQSLQLIIYGFSNCILSILAVAAPIWMGYGIEESLKCLIALNILKIILLFFLIRKNSIREININRLKVPLLYSIPLVVSILISGSADYIDGALVLTHFGSKEFAIFRYGARELPLALILANALSTAFVPRLALKDGFEKSLSDLKTESAKLMHLLFPLSILLLLTSKWLYPLLLRQEFVASAFVFNIYLILLISRVIFPQTIVLAKQNTRLILKTAVAEITINIIMSYTLMQYFGIAGVAMGTLIAFFSEKAILMAALYFKEKIRPDSYIPIKLWICYAIALFTCYILTKIQVL